MKKLLLFLFVTISSLVLLPSCKDDDKEPNNEYKDWKNRNEAFFTSINATATQEIARAKAQYGDDWTVHCEWRAYQSYSLSQGATSNTKEDSIYVKVINTGNGSGYPLSTDSVRVFYAGRLMPSESYADGYMFDHSGQSNILENIFNRETSKPASFLVNVTTRGFATALQHMHIGDRWRVYVPYKLGYEKTEKDGIPAYSTLVFDIELVQYARAGNKLPEWI